jgi:hypothetical protein
MTTFLMDIVQSVFKPSVAALSISVAVAIVSLENTPNSVRQDTVNLSALGCSGLLKPICSIRLF